MSERTIPPFRADHVGSLIRPDPLIAARQAAERDETARAALRRIQENAIRDVVRLQEEIGFRLVTDGEFNRGSWQRDFLLKLDNVELIPSRLTVKFHSTAGTRDHSPPSLRVAGKLHRPHDIFVDDFRFLKSVARAVPKVTIPSPTVLHFRGGREAIAALADAGCRYLQIDEVNLAYLCDPALRGEVANMGEDPASLPATYARLLNAAIADRPRDMVVCMHLCRGNFAGAWIAEGGYDPIADLLFNQIEVDGYFLEYDTPRAGSFAPLRLLPAGKVAVLGLVTTKGSSLETKAELKRRIDEASRYAPVEQLALSPQCGFSSGIGGQAMTVDDQIAKLRLVADTARAVWGST
jgi:methionine synthase II (cobalamin-independent)